MTTDLRLKFLLICCLAMVSFAGLLTLDNALARQNVRMAGVSIIIENTRADILTVSVAALSLDDAGPAARRELGSAATSLRQAAMNGLLVKPGPFWKGGEVAPLAIREEILFWADLAQAVTLAYTQEAEIEARSALRRASLGDLLPRIDALLERTTRQAERLRQAETAVRVAGLIAIGALLGLIWLMVIRPLVVRQGIVLKRLRRNEHAARELAGQTARADEAKANFLSVISHELRTPMNGILGCAELIRVSSEVDRDRALAETICASGADLLAIVSNILDFTDLKSGSLQLFDGVIDPEQLVEEAREKFGAEAAVTRTKFEVNLIGDPDRMRRGDMARVTQALSNLVDNAIRFSPKGAVFVTVDNRFARALTLTVRDTGQGMTPPEVARAFDPFSQADDGETRAQGGTGMGLTIVKKLADAMGGDVRLQSRVGAGTNVILSLPLPFGEGPAKASPQSEAPTKEDGGRTLSAA